MYKFGTTAGANVPKGLDYEIEMVDAGRAAELLETNIESNRPFKKNRINAYAEDMKAGVWQFNAQPILRDSKGRIIDGQNRLMAVIEADVAIPFLIVSGINPSAIRNIDTGAGRNLADVLTIEKWSNPKELSPTLTIAANYERYMEDKVLLHSGTIQKEVEARNEAGKAAYRRFSGSSFTRAQAFGLLTRRPTLEESVITMKPYCWARKNQTIRPPIAVVSLLHNIATFGEGTGSVIEYTEAVREGAGSVLSAAHQVNKQLVNAAQRKHGQSGYMTTETKSVLWMRGYEAFIGHIEEKEIRISRGRTYPTIPGDVEWYVGDLVDDSR